MPDSLSNILFWEGTDSREDSDLDDIRTCLSDDFLNLGPEELGPSSSKCGDKFLTDFDFFGDTDEPEIDTVLLPLPAGDPEDALKHVAVEVWTMDSGDELTTVSFDFIAEAAFL
jgi:hypothetical protein